MSIPLLRELSDRCAAIGDEVPADTTIRWALRSLGCAAGLEHLFLARLAPDREELSVVHEWSEDGETCAAKELLGLPLDELAAFCDTLKRDGVMLGGRLWPPDGAPSAMGALVGSDFFAVLIGGRLRGFLGTARTASSRRLSRRVIDLMRVSGQLMICTLDALSTEERLREGRDRLRRAQRIARIGYWSLSRATGEAEWDDNAREILGVSADRPAGLRLLKELVHPADWPALETSLMRSLTEGSLHKQEYRVLQPEGGERWIACWGAAERTDGGAVEGLVGIVQDISERRDEQERLSLMQYALDQVADGAFLVDARGRLHYVNEGACRALGYAREDLVSMSFYEVDPYLPPERWRELWALLRNERSDTFESLHVHRDGRLIPVEVNATYISHRRGAYVLALARDVSERHAAEEKLRQSDAAFESSADGMLVTDPRMRIVSVNRALCEISGYEPSEVLGQTPEVLGSGRSEDGLPWVEMCASAERGDRWQGEVWNRRKDGALYPAQLTLSAIRDRNGVVHNYVAVLSDITVMKRSQEELEHLAHHDCLTGLPNRLLFDARLIHALERGRRDGRCVTVLFVDLDRFKAVNDNRGHLAGDELLRQVAERLGQSLRADDTVARIGGDEFAVILEGAANDAERALVARKLVQRLREPFAIEGQGVSIGASIGIARYPDDAVDAATLVSCADAAMYLAKSAGGQGFCLHQSGCS